MNTKFKSFLIFISIISWKRNRMPSQIFVNLPVKDLNKTIEFFKKLGFKFNPQFTDENATCMIVNENIYVMLLVEKIL